MQLSQQPQLLGRQVGGGVAKPVETIWLPIDVSITNNGAWSVEYPPYPQQIESEHYLLIPADLMHFESITK